MTHSLKLVPSPVTADPLPLQPASLDIWDEKYRLKDEHGVPVDQTLDDTLKRIARALVDIEPAEKSHWYERFLWALRHGAVPAGRILSNAGAGRYKPETATINCTVSPTLPDSMDGIMRNVHDAALTLKSGTGIGYDFSTLRPRGALVNGAGARTSGPVPFMDVFDTMCATVSSAGGRRGAQMATFDIGHPDVEELIAAKREPGRLRHFNISLLVTREFMEAVERDGEWLLAFPATREEIEREAIALDDAQQIVWRTWPVIDRYQANGDGLVAMKIYKRVSARDLWSTVMKATYEFAEPGFMLIDRINEMNNNWFCETIRASNPCGEQGLPPGGACLLGSVDLTRFVREPFSPMAYFDWESFTEVVRLFTRMLDNVVEINGLPMSYQRNELRDKRRHGMGYFGLASAMAMLGHRYGDLQSVEFTESVTRQLAIIGWETGIELAMEKGPAPIMDRVFRIDESMLRARPALREVGYTVGDELPGRELFARYSRYMQQLGKQRPDLIEGILAHGCRFTHHSSIAPTGTIALSLGNNASNGIEPTFSHRYTRNVIREGRATKEAVPVESFELLAYRACVDPNATPADLPANCVTTDEVSPDQHIAIQAAAQRWIDSSISKTINVPTDFPFEDFEDIYLSAYRQGLKGCTTFRFNPDAFSGVLMRDDDLRNTQYTFVLDDGSSVTVSGDESVEYQGEIHNAANLHEALREGSYGKL